MENEISSQVKVQWYRTFAQSHAKSRHLKVLLEDARDVKLLLFANQSERSIQSEIRGCTIIILISMNNFFYAMRDRQWLVPYDACGTNQLEAQLLVATFSRDCVVEQYHDILTCKDKDSYIQTPNIIIKIGYMWYILVKETLQLILRKNSWFFVLLLHE